nr:HAD hydrolase-like protein [Rubritepida sp.]
MLRALIWDVDGTLAETERDGHRVAFNLAFEEHGLPWRWDAVHYGALLAVTGGRERLLHDMAARPDAPADADEREALARRLHATKTRYYTALVERGAIALRPGVHELLDECTAAGLPMAIATTTTRANVGALLA